MIAYLQILCYIKDAGNVELIFVVKIDESLGKIFLIYLPNSHKDQLVIWMSGKEYSKHLGGIFDVKRSPRFLKNCKFLRYY